MMKKLIALGLCLLMVLSVCLTGCSEKTNEEAVADISEKASKSAMTLSLYLMSDAKVEKCENCVKADAGEAGAKTCVDLNLQACTYREISNAVNRVTEGKYKTRLVLHYYTEAEYYQKLEESFAKREAAKKAGLLGNTVVNETSTEDETFINDLGQVQIKYPSIAGYQVDIFYFGGQERFEQYSKGGLLSQLDSQLSDASKQLKKYIPDKFLGGVKTLGGGKTYAIPTNRMVGEYTYLLLNKNALSLEYCDPNNENYKAIASDDMKTFLTLIQNDHSDKYYPIKLGDGITLSDVATQGMNFFGVDEKGNFSNSFSLMGGYYQSGQDSFSKAFYGAKVLEDAQFEATLRTLKEYEAKDYFVEEANKDFAVGYLKGDASIAEQYSDDYVIYVLETPTMGAKELCEHMMGVSANTTSLERSMQILTLLNTDVEFRNLVLYGIQDKHYRVIDTKVEKNDGSGDTYLKVERMETSYLMDENKTGNVFISYPLQQSGAPEIDPALRDKQSMQNRDLLLDPFMKFALQNKFDIDMMAMQAIRIASEKAWAGYETCDDFEAYWAQAKAEAAIVADFLTDMTNYSHGAGNVDCEKVCGSFGCAFTEWGVSAGIIKETKK